MHEDAQRPWRAATRLPQSHIKHMVAHKCARMVRNDRAHLPFRKILHQRSERCVRLERVRPLENDWYPGANHTLVVRNTRIVDIDRESLKANALPVSCDADDHEHIRRLCYNLPNSPTIFVVCGLQ